MLNRLRDGGCNEIKRKKKRKRTKGKEGVIRRSRSMFFKTLKTGEEEPKLGDPEGLSSETIVLARRNQTGAEAMACENDTREKKKAVDR